MTGNRRSHLVIKMLAHLYFLNWGLVALIGYPKAVHAQMTLSIGMGAFSDQKVSKNHPTSEATITARYIRQSTPGEGSGVHYSSNIGVFVSDNAESLPYPLLKELSAKGRPWANSMWSAGLLDEQWSVSDKYFNLGIWNSRMEFMGLHSEQQGRVAISWDQKVSPTSGVQIQWSPLHLPDIGPQVIERDGELLSSNRWFQSPFSSVVLFGNQVQVDYTLNTSSATDIVTSQGLLAQLYYKDKTSFVKLMGAVKPMNQILVGYRRPYLLPTSNEDRIKVEVTPAVVLHKLTSIEIGSDLYGDRWVYNYTVDTHSEVVGLPQEFLYPEINSAEIQSIIFESPVLQLRRFGNIKGYFGAYRIDQNEGLSGKHSDLEIDYKWGRYLSQDHWALKGEWTHTIFGSQVAKLDWTWNRSISLRGQSSILTYNVLVGNGLAYTVGIDSIGSSDRVDPGTYYDKFKNNDRFFVELNYEF